jgi:leucyl-tRNA synthetase
LDFRSSLGLGAVAPNDKMLHLLMTRVAAVVVAWPSVSDEAWNETVQGLLLMLAPSAPHVSEELWTITLGLPYSIHRQPWPTWDEQLAAEDELKIGVTINGKPRGELVIPAGLADDEDEVKRLALELPRVKTATEGQTIRRVIYRTGKLLNLVVS